MSPSTPRTTGARTGPAGVAVRRTHRRPRRPRAGRRRRSRGSRPRRGSAGAGAHGASFAEVRSPVSRTPGRVGDTCVSSVTRRRGGTFGCEWTPTAVIGGIRPTSVVVVLAREPEAVARERLTRGIRGRSFDVLLACFASSVGADAAILLVAPDAAGPRAIASWGSATRRRASPESPPACSSAPVRPRGPRSRRRATACARRRRSCAHTHAPTGVLDAGFDPPIGAAARGARLGGRVLRAPGGAVHARGRHGRGLRWARARSTRSRVV